MESVSRPRDPNEEKLEAALREYGESKIQTILLSVVHKQLRTIEAQVKVVIGQTQRLSHDLTRLSMKFENLKPSEFASLTSQVFEESVACYVRGVREMLLGNRVPIIRELESAIEGALTAAGYPLQKFLDHRIELSDVLLQPMNEHARDVVSQAVANIHCRLIDDAVSEQNPAGGPFRLPHLIHNLIAKHWQGGPRDRESFSVLIPMSADALKLKQQMQELGNRISVVNLITNGITLLRRIDNVSPFEYLQTLTQGEDIYRDLAARLHSREDVDWTQFAPMDIPAKPGGGNGPSNAVQIDQTAVLQT